MPNEGKVDGVVAGPDYLETFLENTFEYWFDDELERKGLSREDFRKGRVFIKSPFAGSQFEDFASADDSEVEVRINDDAEIKLIAKLKAGRSVEKGDPLTADDLAGFEEVILTEEQEDYAHVTVADMGSHGYYINFDFRYNRTYYQPLLEAASQFIATAEFAAENEMWRAFVENAFHASERMMKLEIIRLGHRAENHNAVQSEYRKFGSDDDLYDIYNQLKDKYRYSAGYVDPAGNVEEREFEFDADTAQEYMAIIQTHFNNLDESGHYNVD